MVEQKELQMEVPQFQDTFRALEQEIGRVIVGNEDIVRDTLTVIFAGGHVLLEGVPGLGKTLLVKSIADALGLDFKRIQFTPDLMPSDVTGTQILTEGSDGRKDFVFRPGPLFAHVVLADEINRASPKTQSALLEAMEEHQVTVLGESHKLFEPFFVLATQNPVELEGTYPLPEAQLDRFQMKLLLKAPSGEQLKSILKRTTGAERAKAAPISSPDSIKTKIAGMRKLVRSVAIAESLHDVLVQIITTLNPNSTYATEKVKKYVRFGPGPRGAQSLILCAKVHALLDGRMNLDFSDVQKVIFPCLRHRLVLNFHADADGIDSDMLLDEVKTVR